MSTAHTTEEEIREHFEEPEVVREKSLQLAAWIMESKHSIAFTGAGISTACGIPDFRGPTGVWTLQAKGEVRKEKTVSSLQAIPSSSHMSLVRLIEAGHLKYLISQNTDGLHRKSGVPPPKFSELHGNTTIEICTKCKREYMRDFRTRTAMKVHDHLTGRNCSDPKCGGPLADSIINFGEDLPAVPLDKAFQHGRLADLCLSLGSSLRVTPAAEIPRMVAQRGKKLVIVNLQTTPLDKFAALIIRARIDDVMRIVMEAIGLETPPFILRRYLDVNVQVSKEALNHNVQVSCHGVDVDGIPASYLQQISVQLPGYSPVVLGKEPWAVTKKPAFYEPGAVELLLTFFGNYAEPHLKVNVALPELVDAAQVELRKSFVLEYHVLARTWAVRER